MVLNAEEHTREVVLQGHIRTISRAVVRLALLMAYTGKTAPYLSRGKDCVDMFCESEMM